MITITGNFSSPVYVTGTPTLQLNDSEVATYKTGSGTNSLSFTYTVKAGDNVSDLMVTGLGLTGATITDVAGNPVSGPAQGDLHLQIDTTPPKIDTTPPTVSSLSASSNSLFSFFSGQGDVVTITVATSEKVFVSGTPTLQLNDNEVAQYAGGSGTNALTFVYTVQQNDLTFDLAVTGLNLPPGSGGATASIHDAAGDALSGPVQADLHMAIVGVIHFA